MVGPAGAIEDVLYGGDGLDMLYGGEGRDSFIFESGSAFNNIDQIFNFNEFERDSIDLSDLLIGYTLILPINDFVQLTETGGNTIISVDVDGLTGGINYVDVASIQNTVGLNIDNFLTNKNIIV